MSGAALDVLATHSIAEIGQESWDGLSKDRPFASYQWYRFGECVMAGRTPLYIIVSRGGEALARASFWLVRDEPLPLESRPVRRALGAFLQTRPLLICRSPVSDASGMVLPEAADLRQPALTAILETAQAYARKAGASFLVCDYLSPEQASLTDWPQDWPAVRLDEPGTGLSVRWNSYTDYLKDLSKSAGKDYRRERNQAERLGLRITTGPVANIDEALPLIRAVEGKHSAAPKPWARAILENAGMVPSIWIDARVGDRLAGCGLLLADASVYVATLLGLDYDFSYVYFQLIYSAIDQAITHGARTLRAGSGAYAFKQRLGFTIEENNHLRFTGQGRVLNFLGRRFAG